MRVHDWILSALISIAAAVAPFHAQPSQPEREAREARTWADYRATLKRLGLGELRRGADGWNRNAPNAANFDEWRSGPTAPLPPLLTQRIRTARHWRKRRAEISELLEREVYGRVPASAPRIVWEKVSSQRLSKGGKPVFTTRYAGRPADAAPGRPSFAMELAVTLPADTGRPVPLALDLGFPEGFRFPGAPQAPPGPDWTDHLVQSGWGYAILVPSTVQPDDGAGLSEGVVGYAAAGRPRAPDDWGALRAWAWGASRALDLLLQNPAVAGDRVTISGLSRYGKAALVAMAFDQRFSAALIGSSGAGGAKLLRRNFGERLENLTSSGEYHWFAPNFLKYGGPLTVADLPVDGHSLIALAAPRAVFIGAGNFDADGWVDPRGSFEAARAASTVYRLLEQPGLVGETYPALEELRGEGRIAFRQHKFGHVNGPNWPAFIALRSGSGPPGLEGSEMRTALRFTLRLAAACAFFLGAAVARAVPPSLFARN